ncbi:MAG: Fe-S cluster assembly protein SufD [Deltaproteobacteria bacterium]|nr:MAG: Fe-S cluster assembly protein SufD [Deltaproteobacteria bacterium]
MMTTSDLNSIYLDQAEGLTKSTSYLKPAKEEALSFFKKLGLPHKKLDSWKYSRIEKRIPSTLVLNKTAEVNKLAGDLIYPDADLIVLVNGNFSSELSKISSSLSYQYEKESNKAYDDLQIDPSDAFDNLSLLLTEGTHTITLKDNEVLTKPIQVIHLNEGNSESTITSRFHFEAGKFSKATMIEMHLGNGNNTDYGYSTFSLSDGANIEHIKIGMNNSDSTHVGKVSAKLKKDSTFHSFTLCLGGGLVRNHVKTNLVESGAHAEVNGLYALQGEHRSDNYTEIHHNASHTTSGQLFKGILADSSRGIFTGRVFIHRDAQKVDANQLNKNLLLSKEARIDTRPQLEVYADDVKCAHGATIGQLNEEELFYLQARGIPKQEAYEMLMAAFSEDALMKVTNPTTKKWLADFLEDHFEKTRKK